MMDVDRREALLKMQTAMLVDAMDSLGLPECVLDPAIRPIVPLSRMVGTAVTVALLSEENPDKADLTAYRDVLMSSKAVHAAIIVVEVPLAHHHCGVFGEGAATVARKAGYVGALVEGGVRDTAQLHEMGFSAFSRTIAPGLIEGKVRVRDTHKPVCIGGQIIHNGDTVAADNDGVIVVSAQDIDCVLQKALEMEKWERTILDTVLREGKHIEEARKLAGPRP